MPLSPTTILRQVMALPPSPPGQGRILGLDDWAWLRGHPESLFISRGQSLDYATVARLGVPQSWQVADRFHLLKNLGERLEQLLICKQRCLQQAARALCQRRDKNGSPAQWMNQVGCDSNGCASSRNSLTADTAHPIRPGADCGGARCSSDASHQGCR